LSTTERGGALVGDSCLALAGAWGVAVAPVVTTTGLFVPDVRTALAAAVSVNRELVATYQHGPVFVWHLRDGTPTARIVTGSGSVGALAFSPDGNTLAVGHAGIAGGSVTFWEPLTGVSGPERDFGVGPVTALAYAPDGLTLAVGGRTGLVVVDTE
jgi:WD40 repeat protein